MKSAVVGFRDALPTYEEDKQFDTFILDILAHNSGIIKFGKRIWSW